MATISINIPTDKTAEVIEALCYGKYQDTITDAEGNSVPNPVTKAQFAKQQVI